MLPFLFLYHAFLKRFSQILIYDAIDFLVRFLRDRNSIAYPKILFLFCRMKYEYAILKYTRELFSIQERLYGVRYDKNRAVADVQRDVTVSGGFDYIFRMF
jgi:hypothetical protein